MSQFIVELIQQTSQTTTSSTEANAPELCLSESGFTDQACTSDAYIETKHEELFLHANTASPITLKRSGRTLKLRGNKSVRLLVNDTIEIGGSTYTIQAPHNKAASNNTFIDNMKHAGKRILLVSSVALLLTSCKEDDILGGMEFATTIECSQKAPDDFKACCEAVDNSAGYADCCSELKRLTNLSCDHTYPTTHECSLKAPDDFKACCESFSEEEGIDDCCSVLHSQTGLSCGD